MPVFKHHQFCCFSLTYIYCKIYDLKLTIEKKKYGIFLLKKFLKINNNSVVFWVFFSTTTTYMKASMKVVVNSQSLCCTWNQYWLASLKALSSVLFIFCLLSTISQIISKYICRWYHKFMGVSPDIVMTLLGSWFLFWPKLSTVDEENSLISVNISKTKFVTFHQHWADLKPSPILMSGHNVKKATGSKTHP